MFPVVAERAARGWRTLRHAPIFSFLFSISRTRTTDTDTGHGYGHVNHDNMAGDARLERATFGSGDQTITSTAIYLCIIKSLNIQVLMKLLNFRKCWKKVNVEHIGRYKVHAQLGSLSQGYKAR